MEFGLVSFKNRNIFIAAAFFLILFQSSTYAAQNAPDFVLKGDQGPIKLSSYRGKVVYVDFWASWCKPCRKSFPFLNQMHKRYKNKGLKVIGINLDTEKGDARKFLSRFPAEFTIAYDPEGKTPQKYQLSVMPTSYIIDQDGRLIKIHKGFKESQAQDIEQLIQQALANR